MDYYSETLIRVCVCVCVCVGGVICFAGSHKRAATNCQSAVKSARWEKTSSSPLGIVQERKQGRGKKRGGVRVKERELEVAAVKLQYNHRCVCVCYEWRRRGVNVRLRVLLGGGGAPAGDGNPRLENKIKTGERCVHLERRVRPF